MYHYVIIDIIHTTHFIVYYSYLLYVCNVMVLKFIIRTNNWIHVAKTVVTVQNIFNIIMVL